MSEETALEVARQRLLAALQRQSLSPESAAIGAYLNNAFQSARLNAMVEFVTTQGDATEARMDELVAKHMTRQAEVIEDILQDRPRILTANGVAPKALNGSH